MKKILTLFLFAAILDLSAMAQSFTSPLVFDSEQFDFGEVNEGDGTLFHTFTFINGASFQVRISNVSASCNCVSVSYPHSYLAGGETGTISVAFNPVGLKGPVQRQIEVFLGDGNHGQTLEITADIVPSEYDINEEYKSAFPSGLRLKALSCKFGYVPVGKSAERSIDVINTSDAPVMIEAEPVNSGSPLTVSCPESLAPGEAGTIIFRYAFSSKGYGSYNDEVRVFINGEQCNRLLDISAIAVDDFKKNAQRNPVMQIYPSSLSVKKLPFVDRYFTSFEIANTGKSDLIVRKICVPDGVDADMEDGISIKPGQKRKVSLKSRVPSFNAEVIVNDPVRPYKELRTTTY